MTVTGIVGLGTMGSRMASRLVAHGHRVVAFDVSPAARERAASAGVEIAVSPAEVAATAPAVLLSLPTPAIVEAVVTGPDGVLARPRAGCVIADTSTVDPDTTRRMAALAAEAGASYLDAPVLGRPDACGSWTFPVGGDADALETIRPVLDVLGRAAIHAGPAGAGNAIKLLNNLMFGAINMVTAEAMALGAAVGVDPAAFFAIVADSGAATVSPLFRQVGGKIVERDFSPTFSIDLLHKDVRLAAGMLDAGEETLPVARAVIAFAEAARAAGLGDEDTSAVVKVYEGLLRASPANQA